MNDEVLRPVGTAPPPAPGEDPLSGRPSSVVRHDSTARELLESGVLVSEIAADPTKPPIARILRPRHEPTPTYWLALDFLTPHMEPAGPTPVVGPFPDAATAEIFAAALLQRPQMQGYFNPPTAAELATA